MRFFLRSCVATVLALLAHGIVRRYRPKIIMVTGSVGKTSTKDAIASVLRERFYLRKSEKSQNSEFGVPFTIFGVKNPWGSPLAWLRVFREAFALLLLPNHYPNLLVLEVGADRPGDLAKILRIATPDAVVVTRLPDIPVHVEAYENPEAVREEEFSPAYTLSGSAPLIVSADDPFAMQLAMRVSARLISYGNAPEATLRILGSGFYEKEGRVIGMEADIVSGKEKAALVVEGSVGQPQLSPAVAAIATAQAFGMSLTEAIEALKAYVPPPGRGRLFAGKNDSVLIDDSYNASPAAVDEALSNLKAFPRAKRRIAVLGDMLELGRYSVKEHERVGALAAEVADVVVGVGIRAKRIAEAARQAGLKEDGVFSYEDSYTAAKALSAYLLPGDVVLIKGSQSIRTERIVEALLANHGDIVGLVRQEKEWKRRT